MAHSYQVLTVRPAAAADAQAIAAIHERAWGGPIVAAHGVAYDLTTLPTLVAEESGDVAGVLSYSVNGDSLEVVSIDAATRGRGVGTALLAAVVRLATDRGLGRVWLVTTNDNMDALRFYQRRGMRLCGLAPGAIDASRALKPSIPELGGYGIPLRDELTLEFVPGVDRFRSDRFRGEGAAPGHARG